jgi:hypothetical protein
MRSTLRDSQLSVDGGVAGPPDGFAAIEVAVFCWLESAIDVCTTRTLRETNYYC